MKRERRLVYWRLASLLWLLFLGCAYVWPSDALYAITIWPPFVWAGLAIVLTLYNVRRQRSRLQFVAIAGWVLFWLVLGEDKSWFRRMVTAQSGGIHVVSLNCAGGSPEAAAEAFQTHPQIVLLQESPQQRDIEKAAGPNYSVLTGPDASIATIGRLERIDLPRGTSNFVAARVTLKGQEPILVVSLRLQPPVFSLDYWDPGCWQSYAHNRASRRREIAEVVAWIRSHAGRTNPVIVGGDFNTPPDSGTFASLDEFAWPCTSDSGYTAVNEFPMARIDQVWARSLFPGGSRAVRTLHSDHRKVLLWLRAD